MVTNDFTIKLDRLAASLHPDFNRECLVFLSQVLVNTGVLTHPLPLHGEVPEEDAQIMIEWILDMAISRDPDFEDLCMEALERQEP